MKAGIYFTGSGPVLILTSYESLSDPRLVRKLKSKGIEKFVAFDVPVEMVKRKYGVQYDHVMNDLKQEDDLRVMDFDGRRVFYGFTFGEMGTPIYHEPHGAQPMTMAMG